MSFVSFVAALALLEYLIITLLTGRARATYKVEVPATTGHPMFERWYRVQQNTVEQLVVFVPALFLFAEQVSPRIAGLLGLLFVAGRWIYARSYIADPSTRGLGFGLSFFSTAALVVGALIGSLV
jgi:glutathione S-transferase